MKLIHLLLLYQYLFLFIHLFLRMMLLNSSLYSLWIWWKKPYVMGLLNVKSFLCILFPIWVIFINYPWMLPLKCIYSSVVVTFLLLLVLPVVISLKFHRAQKAYRYLARTKIFMWKKPHPPPLKDIYGLSFLLEYFWKRRRGFCPSLSNIIGFLTIKAPYKDKF